MNRQNESNERMRPKYKDYGAQPFVVNLESTTLQNSVFRRTLWTGHYMQMTLMSIPVGGEIGLENHPDTDQFIHVEYGRAVAKFGDCCDKMKYSENVGRGSGIFVPAGTWHNIINDGRVPLKLYTIYAPPHHLKGTVHLTKEDAE